MKEHVMLRKSLLSLLVAAATISTASAATVYNNEGTVFNVTGRVQANLNSKYANNNPEKTDKTAIEGSARLGLNGQTKLNEDFAAVAFAEWNVASESSENGKFDTRLLAFQILRTVKDKTPPDYGLAQAQAVIFFVLIAAVTLVQVSITKKKEVEA